MALISAPPATTRSPARTVRRPIISVRPTTAAANSTPHSDCVPLSGAATVTRPRASASTKHEYASPSVSPAGANAGSVVR